MQCGLAASQAPNDAAVPTQPLTPAQKFRENNIPPHQALLPDSLPALCAQVLQLKWQMFYVQKSQQELATAILQLSSLIFASSASSSPAVQGSVVGPLSNVTPAPPPGALLDPTESGKPPKRKWNGRSEETGQEKISRPSSNGRIKFPRGPLPHILTKTLPPPDCSCETCLAEQQLPSGDRNKQTVETWPLLNSPMKLKWDCPLPHSLPLTCPPRPLTATEAVLERRALGEPQAAAGAGPAWPGSSLGRSVFPPDFPSLSTAPPLPQANALSQQTPADLYVSYLLGTLESGRMGNCGDSMEPTRLPSVPQQDKPIDLVTRSRIDTEVAEPAGLTTNLHDSFSDGDVPQLHSILSQPTVATASEGSLATPADSLEISPRSSSHSCVFVNFGPNKSLKRRHTDPRPGGKFSDESSSAVEDLLNFGFAGPCEDETDGGEAEGRSGSGVAGELTSWTPDVLGDKEKAIVVLNPAEPREMFVGGDSAVRLPVWAYKKCIYMVGREQKRPAARLCLCLLQSLFSLRYLVSHNYSGSRQKRPIEPTVMKAVIKQSLMQFGPRSSFGDHFAQGKLRDYLNNAFRVMAFRRRRGDRVKSPFWNDAGEPILTLDPPKDFRLNGLIVTEVLPVR
ncbi:hypothetical protein AAHC03_04722 [Spirometra sp. Aus1]